MRVINQPDNNDALSRIINVPSRRIGEATIKGLLEEADLSKVTFWGLILSTVQGKRSAKTKLSSQTEKGLRSFVDIILTAIHRMKDPEHRYSIVELINYVLRKTDYEKYLEDHHGDVTKARWANVDELKTQASDFQELVATGIEDEALPEIDGIKQDDESDPLPRFLATVALASEVKNEEENGAGTPTAQVTISTIHAAKGLEWPVVFIPAAYQGSIPHSRSEDTDEERRLLYVAMTRAKALLYMSHPLKNSQGEQSTLSPFLSGQAIGKLLDEKGPSLQSSTVQSISQILRRPLPSVASIVKSSENLRSDEDNLFPLGGENEEHNDESRWSSDTGNLTYSMGQRPVKRQRIELGRPVGAAEESKASWKRTYTTTMDQSSRFTTTSVAFGSAKSHLQVLSEHSVNCAIEKERPELVQDPQKPNSSGKHKSKLREGQGTLNGFLGRPEPQILKRSKPDSQYPTTSNTYMAKNTINQPRVVSTTSELIGISPALGEHRLGMGKRLSRPQHTTSVEQIERNDYVFLSSSPPRAKPPEPDPVETPPAVLTSNPPLLPLIRPPTIMNRPAITMHMTSVAMVQNTASKKTLGVKRSMNGWPPQKGKAYVPPTIRRT